MTNLAWLIPLLPLLGFVVNGLFGKKLSKSLVGIIGSGAVLASFLISLGIFFEIQNKGTKSSVIKLFDWIDAGALNIDFSFLIDPLSSLFLLIITGVGFLIHVYSIGYMNKDEGFFRFFAYLNLFIFFMLLLVLGSNYVIMFVGWEGVGLCSYLLIGFWFKNNPFNNAAKKAFIMNRIGDLGFLLGIILIFITFGSVEYTEVFDAAGNFGLGDDTLKLITILLFIGAIGKSAQVPLFTWLPDAMAGPTPVSALIHAATMVTAGIYMIARSNILFTLSPDTMHLVAGIGAFTALFAASIGLFQNDIKKVLAYSTVSQLGFMFLALGVGAYTAAVFHVMTHAFFKALLFLGSGSVIHAMSDEQDIRSMGGLKKALPITHLTFLIGTLAIVGFPPLSGFFSKDEILAHAFAHNPALWTVGIIAALFTTFYMFRIYFLTFHGKFRGTAEQESHLHESPKSMTIPLIVLAALSVVGGFVGIPKLLGGSHSLNEFLRPVFKDSSFRIGTLHLSHTTEYVLLGIAIVAAIAAAYFAYTMFVQKGAIPPEDEEETPKFQKLIYNKYYIDELYAKVFTRPLDAIGRGISKYIEPKIIDGFVNSIGNTVQSISAKLRQIQTGYIGTYVFIMVISLILIIAYTAL